MNKSSLKKGPEPPTTTFAVVRF